MITEIKRLWYALNALKSKVNCVCNRPNIPQPPSEGNWYLGSENGVLVWRPD